MSASHAASGMAMASPGMVNAMPSAAAVPIQQGAQMMLVTCPHGMQPGQPLQVTAPGGQALQVTVPPGVQPGQQFQVQVRVCVRVCASLRRPMCSAAATLPRSSRLLPLREPAALIPMPGSGRAGCSRHCYCRPGRQHVIK